MISISNQSGHTRYNVIEFICDSIEDIQNLPIENIAPGSTAIVVPNETQSETLVYMLNNKHEWHPL